MTISRRLTVARTSNRLATFAHAMSKTKLTAPINTKREERMLLTIASCNSSALKPCPAALLRQGTLSLKLGGR